MIQNNNNANEISQIIDDNVNKKKYIGITDVKWKFECLKVRVEFHYRTSKPSDLI